MSGQLPAAEGNVPVASEGCSLKANGYEGISGAEANRMKIRQGYAARRWRLSLPFGNMWLHDS